jgi:hypothetical protein
VFRAAGLSARGRPIPVLTHIRLRYPPNMVPKYDLAAGRQNRRPSAALARDLESFDPDGK